MPKQYRKKPISDSESEQEKKVTVQEMIQIRQFKRKKGGLNASSLLNSHSKEEDSKLSDSLEFKMKRIKNEFATESTTMNTEKHMLAFIEKELAILKGKTQNGNALTPQEQTDYEQLQKELFAIPEHLRVNSITSKHNDNVSMGMLTAIPEVDLGIQNKVENMQRTAKTLEQGIKKKEIIHTDLPPRFQLPNDIDINKATDYRVLERFKKRMKK